MANRRTWRVLSCAGVVLFAGCHPDVDVRGTVPSPDGALVARYYSLSGGGGAGYIDEYVDVQPTGAAFRARGDGYALGMTHAGGVTLAWDGPRHLIVTHPAWADVFRRCPRSSGAAITYVPRAEPDPAWGEFGRAEYQNHLTYRSPPRTQSPTAGCG